LKTYRGKVTALSGQEQLELDAAAEGASPDAANRQLPLIDKASA
jgi:hypothetical protein